MSFRIPNQKHADDLSDPSSSRYSDLQVNIQRNVSKIAILLNSPVSCSLWPLNIKEVKTYFFTGLASIWSNIFTNSNEKKTCLLLCLLCIFKFQTLSCRNFWIFYFMWRLTQYKCAVNVCIQQKLLIRNWTIIPLCVSCPQASVFAFKQHAWFHGKDEIRREGCTAPSGFGALKRTKMARTTFSLL